MSRILDRWGAIIRLLVFSDERGTISEHADRVAAEAREHGTHVEAAVENVVYDMSQDRDVLRDLINTFQSRR